MKRKMVLWFELDLKEWALPLEIWWEHNHLCFEVLCFSVTFKRDGGV